MNVEIWSFQTLYSFRIIVSFKFIDNLTAYLWFIGDIDPSSERKSEPRMKMVCDM
jgi:hypothetical protein